MAERILTKEYIKIAMHKSPDWLCRGVVAIFEMQTHDEQLAESTQESNGVGFNGVDAYILSSFAKQINAGRTLSKKQLAIALKKMPKYAGQLLKIATREA